MILFEEIKAYAVQWNASAKFMFENHYYQWMAEKIKKYRVVLELGCGTGYSTLELINQGHHVIAVDKNQECINASRKLISENGFNESNVTFVEGDFTDSVFRNELINNYNFDIVICWNIGTFWSKSSEQNYIPLMLAYGLTLAQIDEDHESSYAELIIWHTCIIAREKGVPVHLIERCVESINTGSKVYYDRLCEDFHFISVQYDNLEGRSLSSGGRKLSVKGEKLNDDIVNLNFASILMK